MSVQAEGDEVMTLLDNMLDEVVKLRSAARMPPVGADGATLVETLLDVRQRVDRVEELLSMSLRVRRGVRDTHREVEQVAADAWDTALTKQRKGPVGLNDEYTAAKERYALANMDTIDQRFQVRAAAAYLAQVETTVEVIRLHYRGLSDMRQDLLAMIRNIQFETTLDR